MFRRASAIVGRAATRGVHTEAKLKQMGIELPTPKPPLGGTIIFMLCPWYDTFLAPLLSSICRHTESLSVVVPVRADQRFTVLVDAYTAKLIGSISVPFRV